MEEKIEILAGGSMNQTVKIGNTVHKTSKGNPIIREYLLYLEEAGMQNVPRFLGLDEQGREIFSYLPGKTMGREFDHTHPCLTSDETIADAARFLRKLHDVSVGFLPEAVKRGWTNPYFPDAAHDTICHGDTGIWNFVFIDDRIASLIDFEQAYPGTRVWDLTSTLFCTALPSCYGYETSKHAEEGKRRIKLFFDAYGVDCPTDIAELTAQRIQVDFIDETLKRAAAGDKECIKMLEGAHLEHYNNIVTHIKTHGNEWL